MRERSQLRRLLYAVTTVVATIVFMLGAALPAWAAEAMTLTFVRHGESEANAAGVIDTSVPGPHLTELGRQQAEAVADALAPNDYDGVYASSMIRTQETAEPLATKLGQDIVVLPGLREIDAGVFEGQSEDAGLGRIGYVLAPAAWTLGARFVPVLGSTDGNVFDARVDDAVQTIYDSGDRNAVVFSHGATIMFWTMMNVDNPDLGLILSHQLDNTAVVVIAGNPEDGWTLKNWDGVEVAAEPSLPTKLFVDVRDVVTAPQTAAYRIGQAFATGDITKIAKAIRDGAVDVTTKVVGFVPKVVNDVVDSLRGSAAVQSDEQVPTTQTVLNAATDRRSLRSLKASAAEPATDTPKDTALTTKKKKTQRSNGATDLTRGNKFHPGNTAVAPYDSTGSDASADDTEKVPSTTEQTGETAGGASDLGSTAKSPDATEKSDSEGDASNDADRKAA
jgi:broad specificity phosphatase PhoE